MQNIEKRRPENKKPKTWKERILEFGRVAAMLSVLGGAADAHAGVMREQQSPTPKDEKEKPTLMMDVEQKLHEAGIDVDFPKMDLTFLIKGQDGRYHFNHDWRSYLLPIMAEREGKAEEGSTVDFDLPFEYERLFATGQDETQPLNPEDHEKLAAFIEQRLRQQIGEKIVAIWAKDFTRNIESQKHGAQIPIGTEIESIRVIGYASPEGPKEKGPQTIESGAIDPENIDLAYKRALSSLNLTEEALQRMGISPDRIKTALREVDAKELQFSDAERARLSILAQGERGATDEERIRQLIIKYNDGNAPEDIRYELDNIVAAKRKVEIAVKFKNNVEGRVAMPIPIWLFFIPLLRHVDPWGKKKDRNPKPQPGEPLVPAETPSPVEPVDPRIPSVQLPPEGTEPFHDAEERVVIDDLAPNFHNESTQHDGVHYSAITNELISVWDQFSDDETRVNYTTQRLLQAWRVCDRNCRRTAGIPEERLDQGLDYENQPRQVRWAKMHARELLQLAQKKRAMSTEQQQSTSYTDLLKPRHDELMQRRLTASRTQESLMDKMSA